MIKFSDRNTRKRWEIVERDSFSEAASSVTHISPCARRDSKRSLAGSPIARNRREAFSSETSSTSGRRRTPPCSSTVQDGDNLSGSWDSITSKLDSIITCTIEQLKK